MLVRESPQGSSDKFETLFSQELVTASIIFRRSLVNYFGFSVFLRLVNCFLLGSHEASFFPLEGNISVWGKLLHNSWVGAFVFQVLVT